MEILFTDPYYDSPTPEMDYSPELIQHLSPYDTEVAIYNTDVGHGADCPAYLVQIFSSVDWSNFLTASGAGVTFLLGKRINENIEAWLEIAGKVQKLVGKLSPYRVDENAATLLAMGELQDRVSIKGNIDISVQIIEYSPVPWGKFKLDKRPDAMYVITIKTGESAHIYGIKSNAKTVFNHEFGLGWYDFYNT
ncbi:hypothetical protein [Salinivibrio proteolyticus]|uniref:hypothetical protein n=1 Tax=Salinivibrio proteolyticus TaxID=334715 RepID=UPI000988DC46|nr:hypothetical protein [Salinivibrio proteolyticus]OOF32109.1 hypothetical protein BZJ20_02940 [Salinivibrio proteolyticus]